MTLEHLETLIAFAVVMLGVSLLITVFTQMVSALLGLRGTNLLWGLKTLFGAIDDRIVAQAEEILRRPLVSDSACSKYYSRLKDIPLIGWLIKRWMLASAVRPAELAHALSAISADLKTKPEAQAAALKVIAEEKAAALTKAQAAVLEAEREAEAAGREANPGTDAAPQKAKAEAQAVVLKEAQAAARKAEMDAEAAASRAKEAPATAEAIDKALKDLDPELERQADLLKTAAEKLAPGSVQQADKRVQQLLEKAQASAGKLEVLFNGVMVRVSARFALQMRLWTVLFAGLLVFGAHLSAFRLLDRLWSNPQLRESLVNSRDAMMKEAGTVFALPSGSEQGSALRIAPQAYSNAVKALKGKGSDATKALVDIPPTFESLDAAEKWIEPKLNADENRKKNLIVEYRKLVSVELMNQANRVPGLLEDSAFELIPKPYPGLFRYDGTRDVLGIIFSWVLLSLGAPFWFNALKTLSSLRPILAAAQPPKGKDQAATT